jgi:phospholipase C
MFVENWLQAKGKSAVTDQMPAWRRAHMSNLVKAFDFDHPDYSIPSIPTAASPSVDSSGVWNGYAVCEATYPTTRPPVPYGQQSAKSSLVTESGFKSVRGLLTEGRYLTFESNGYALTAKGSAVTTSKATASHNALAQRWVIHQVSDGGQGSASVTISSAVDGRYIAFGGKLTSNKSQAAVVKIVDQGNGAGYTIAPVQGYNAYYSISKSGSVSFSGAKGSFSIFSVTY